MIDSLLAVVSQSDIERPLLGPVGFILAFFVGTISFFSPCILPLLPGYLSFASGLSIEEADARAGRRRILLGTGLFVLGFATMFSALGMLASVVGSTLREHQLLVNRIAGAIVIVMGLAFLAPALLPFLERERRPFLSRVKPGLAGAFPLGLAFAAGWVPCVGPGLGVMLALGNSESVARGALLLFFFSLGFGFWFLLAALLLRRAITASRWLHQHVRAIQSVGGVFLITIGVLLVTDQWATVLAPMRRLLQWQPPL